MKKNLKKRAVGVTVALVMAASVVACGAKDSGETNSVSASESSQEDVIAETSEKEVIIDDNLTELIDDFYYTKIINIDDKTVTFLTIPITEIDDDKYKNVTADNWEEYAPTYTLALSDDVTFESEVSIGDNAIISVINNQVYDLFQASSSDDIFSFTY